MIRKKKKEKRNTNCHLQDSNLRPRRDCPYTLTGKEKQTNKRSRKETLGSALDHSAKVTLFNW